eukprot:3874590-Rhodomonas_salina.1
MKAHRPALMKNIESPGSPARSTYSPALYFAGRSCPPTLSRLKVKGSGLRLEHALSCPGFGVRGKGLGGIALIAYARVFTDPYCGQSSSLY